MEPMRLPDGGPQTFRPMRSWLNGQTSPEMLYLETKWASLIPFARATDLLKEVLPVGDLGERGDRPKPPATDGRTHRAGVG